ncbi:MAG: hypothetical protein QNK25_06475 [Desulfobacterales bacterium]|nr:hypothetical protein [Desulfobacterales bacterium]
MNTVPSSPPSEKPSTPKRPNNVRNTLVSGVFWRILVIEMILLVWSLGYRAATEESSVTNLFWLAIGILLLVGIIISFLDSDSFMEAIANWGRAEVRA